MNYVTEDMKPQEEWFKRAKGIKSIEEFAAFAKELLEETHHDYGTICHAIGALTIAAGWMGSHMHGITGFQASFVMWDFIRQWQYDRNETGLKIVDYDKMLYPQYDNEFEKTITSKQFEKMQEVAAKRLQGDMKFVHPGVAKHWQSIVDGVVPFGYKSSDDD